MSSVGCPCRTVKLLEKSDLDPLQRHSRHKSWTLSDGLGNLNVIEGYVRIVYRIESTADLSNTSARFSNRKRLKVDSSQNYEYLSTPDGDKTQRHSVRHLGRNDILNYCPDGGWGINTTLERRVTHLVQSNGHLSSLQHITGKE